MAGAQSSRVGAFKQSYPNGTGSLLEIEKQVQHLSDRLTYKLDILGHMHNENIYPRVYMMGVSRTR